MVKILKEGPGIPLGIFAWILEQRRRLAAYVFLFACMPFRLVIAITPKVKISLFGVRP